MLSRLLHMGECRKGTLQLRQRGRESLLTVALPSWFKTAQVLVKCFLDSTLQRSVRNQKLQWVRVRCPLRTSLPMCVHAHVPSCALGFVCCPHGCVLSSTPKFHCCKGQSQDHLRLDLPPTAPYQQIAVHNEHD